MLKKLQFLLWMFLPLAVLAIYQPINRHYIVQRFGCDGCNVISGTLEEMLFLGSFAGAMWFSKSMPTGKKILYMIICISIYFATYQSNVVSWWR